MIKKTFLLIAVLFSLESRVASSNSILPNVPQGHWAYDAMQQLADDGAIKADYKSGSGKSRYDFAMDLAELSDPGKLQGVNLSPADLQLLAKLKDEFSGELGIIKGGLDRAEKDLAKIGEELDQIQEQADQVLDDMKTKKYGGSSNPAINGSYGVQGKDVTGYGHQTSRHGVGMLLNLDMSMTFSLPDGSSFETGFSPAFTPGSFVGQSGSNPIGLDDLDEVHPSTGTGGRAGTLMGSFRMKFVKGSFSGVAGFISFQTSLLTLSGRLSNRPILFDKNPYLSNITSKANLENQFLTGVPKRSAEESEFYIMGLKTDWKPWAPVDVMLFDGYDESFYDYAMPRIGGGTVTLDKADSWGGSYRFIGYNRTNDTGELTGQSVNSGTNSEGFPPEIINTEIGLFNDTIFAVDIHQQIKAVAAELEVGSSTFDNTAGVHVTGQDLMGSLDWVVSPSLDLLVRGYSLSPGFVTEKNLNGANMLQVRPDAYDPGTAADGNFHGGNITHQTVIADPTLPINDTSTYAVGAKFRGGPFFFNFNVQNSTQNAPSDSRIWAHHFLGGENLNGGDWFLLFNYNYEGWYSPITESAACVSCTAQREPNFLPNIRSEGPSNQMMYNLDNYNNTYVPKGAVIHDVNNKFMYGSYHQLEAPLWRQNYEGLVVSDPATGLALAPSTKSISSADGDMRASFTAFGRELFWHAYAELNTVNDSSLAIPSVDPSNLFVQTIADTTLAYNVDDPVMILLYMGAENWASDRTPQQFVNFRGELVKGTLEYHDREAGVGLDWNIKPGKMAFFWRSKILYHYDASAMQNDFTEHQTMFEMKTYF